jgi:hypothetical protein
MPRPASGLAQLAAIDVSDGRTHLQEIAAAFVANASKLDDEVSARSSGSSSDITADDILLEDITSHFVTITFFERLIATPSVSPSD